MSGEDTQHVGAMNRVIGEPTVGIGSVPTFDTDQVVDWTCPCCGEEGYDNPRTADYYPTCANSGCPVKMFTVFRGEPDE